MDKLTRVIEIINAVVISKILYRVVAEIGDLQFFESMIAAQLLHQHNGAIIV